MKKTYNKPLIDIEVINLDDVCLTSYQLGEPIEEWEVEGEWKW